MDRIARHMTMPNDATLNDATCRQTRAHARGGPCCRHQQHRTTPGLIRHVLLPSHEDALALPKHVQGRDVVQAMESGKIASRIHRLPVPH
eukprot:6864910-Alexandrium_andersonii.AAC.1